VIPYSINLSGPYNRTSSIDNFYWKWVISLKWEEHRENKEFDKAEEMYIRGFKYKDALNMYIENEEFENAMRIAKIHIK
jgi:hypothetical protein